MPDSRSAKKFGTAPVFFTAISTILGAIMFLRFGYAVGTVGLLGTFAIVLIGHVVTIPTAMAIAEIATNQKVEGGGEYYIISRSFGLVIGSAIGIALYLSQAISVAFYIIAFAEAAKPAIAWLLENVRMPPWLELLLAYKQTVSIPALLLLTAIVLIKGADLGVKALYFVVATLAVAMVSFFAGSTDYHAAHQLDYTQTVYTLQAETQARTAPNRQLIDTVAVTQLAPGQAVLRPAPPPSERGSTPQPTYPPVSFFVVFAIIFPAFTGMTAGVGLSGDLKDPGRSIPLGTLAGTLTGMVIYFLIAFKLSANAGPYELADTSRLVMADIAWQGWLIIPIGLAAATISSALGSILVAPRTLQAIARDKVLPMTGFNRWLSRGKGKNDEPFNASVVTVLIAAGFVLAGALDSVAEIISMFFMVTYGSLCLISFLNHFASDPSYRPRFRSRWYISLFGAVACFALMFFINGAYALMAILLMVGLYVLLAQFNGDKKSMAAIFQGVIFQFSRQLQVFLQKAEKEQISSWRPSVIAISERTFERHGAFDLLRWIAHKYGFGTYIHHINGFLSREANERAHDCKDRLIRMAEATDSNIYVDTLISPSNTSAIAQTIQLPGIAGTENNLLLVEFDKSDPENLDVITQNFNLIRSVDFDMMVLASSPRGYSIRRELHVWITKKDIDNANLMILLAYVLLGHPDWKRSEIKIFAIAPENELREERRQLISLIKEGRLPISPSNIKFIKRRPDVSDRDIIIGRSQDADLTILGFNNESVRRLGGEVFLGYEELGNVLFVNAVREKEIE